MRLPLPYVAVLPIVVLLLVVVTVYVHDQVTRPRELVVRITNGPTVLSTQIVRLDGR